MQVRSFILCTGAMFSGAVLIFATVNLPAQAQKTDPLDQIHENVMPEASDRMEIDMSAYKGTKDMSEAAVAFRDGLAKQNYRGQGWSFIGDDPAEDPHEKQRANPPALRKTAEVTGFIVVTQIEQYDDAGKPLRGEKRFAVADVSDDKTFMDKVKRVLIGAPIGHYRIFLFAVEAGGAPQRQSTPSTYIAWQKYFLRQYRQPMLNTFKDIKLLKAPLSCTAFVYEFDRASADGELEFRITPRLPIAQHLTGAGLFSALNIK